MSRVVKNVIVWVLALAVIFCIIAGFTFGLSSVSGVADALSSFDLVNNGVVRENLVVYSSAEEIYNDLTSSSSAMWTVTQTSDDFHLNEDGYLSFDGFCSLSYHTSISYDSSYYAVWSVGVLVHTETTTPQSTITSITMASSSRTRQFYFDSTEVNTFQVITQERQFSGDLTRLGFQISSGSYLSLAWVKLEISFGADDVGFTGYVPYSKGTYNEGYDAGYDAGVTDGTETGYNTGYDEGYNAGVTDGTQSGYDDGYADGYDEGYNAGYTNGQVSVRDLFTYSAVNIGHDPNDIYHCYVVNGDSYQSYQDVYLGDIGLKFVPLSKMRYYGYDGGYYPIDLVLPEDGENIPNVADSEYYLEFNSVVEVGQWLLDNPTDFLCSYIITGEMLPAVLVFSDLSGLSSFMSGAGYLYDDFYNDGYDDGFSSGDRNGYNRGYGVGFNDGQVDALDGNYTFLGLIGSVIDAPISAFRGLLDFELLGVNMSSFVLAVMSLCVIIVIIRMVLR